jgi:hypothetical protein
MAPAITSISPTSASTSGGDTLTITGTNLGQFGSATVTVGTVDCKLLSGFEQTSMRCTIPQGMGVGLGVMVTVATQATTSTGANLFSYSAPVINSVSPSSGSTAGSTSSQDLLTITGTSFGQVRTVTLAAYRPRLWLLILFRVFLLYSRQFDVIFFFYSPSLERMAASRSVIRIGHASFRRGSTRKSLVDFRKVAAAT